MGLHFGKMQSNSLFMNFRSKEYSKTVSNFQEVKTKAEDDNRRRASCYKAEQGMEKRKHKKKKQV